MMRKVYLLSVLLHRNSQTDDASVINVCKSMCACIHEQKKKNGKGNQKRLNSRSFIDISLTNLWKEQVDYTQTDWDMFKKTHQY